MDRLHHLQAHLEPTPISTKSPEDVVICSAVRTPVTKAKRGALKDTAPEVMLAAVLK
jgi:acetyl-CoA acyltransferase 1